MDELVSQVRRAQWRMAADRFLAVLGWCWFAGLTAAGVAILACKYYPLGVPDAAWAAGGLGLGLIAAAAWAGVTARRGLDAAIEIDRRYGLKERVSSTLAMPEADRGSEAGRSCCRWCPACWPRSWPWPSRLPPRNRPRPPIRRPASRRPK